MDLTGTSVAITGATGFLGRYLARTLHGHGARVVAVARRPERVPALAALGIEARRADLADPDALRAAFRGLDVVVSNAGLISVGEHGRDTLIQANVEGTRNVLRAAAEAGAGRVIMTSSATVYRPKAGHFYGEDDPLRGADDRVSRFAWYALSKAMAEREAWRLADELGLGLTTFRPHAIHGAFDDHGATAWMRRLTRWPLGLWLWGTRFPSVYAGDLAEAVARMVERPVSIGRAYNLTGEPDTHSFWDLLRAWRQAGGQVSPAVLPLPVPMVRRYDLARAQADLDFVNRPLVDGFRETLALEAAGGL
ncbi:MAG: NAD(P)-dependent oxidoreductase [Alphaproteobacteria bacterium]|nr:NAD(P)-dependent oxidoreductase [Alphaproteobacteria bacterium]